MSHGDALCFDSHNPLLEAEEIRANQSHKTHRVVKKNSWNNKSRSISLREINGQANGQKVNLVKKDFIMINKQKWKNYHIHHQTSHASLCRICTCHIIFEHASLLIASIQEGHHLQQKKLLQITLREMLRMN